MTPLATRPIDEQQIVRFLLGELPEDERQGVEGRLFQDDSFYSHILAIQEELADDYVQGDLTADQRKQFENHFLKSPRRKERVDFAAAFAGALAQNDHAPSVFPAAASSDAKWWSSFTAFVPKLVPMAAGALALILLVTASSLYLQNRRLKNDVRQAQSDRDSVIRRSQSDGQTLDGKVDQLQREIANLRAQGGDLEGKVQEKQKELEALQRSSRVTRVQPSTVALANFILSPGLKRGEDEPEKIIIAPDAKLVQLQLVLQREEKYKTYIAEIRTARGNLISSKSGLTVTRSDYGQVVSLVVPANQLLAGEYELALKGADKTNLEVVGYYYFLALRR
jgi:anti-sigma factor RsiW